MAGQPEAGPFEKRAGRLEAGKEVSQGMTELRLTGAEKSPTAIPYDRPYRKPTQVGESRRLRRSRELSLRN